MFHAFGDENSDGMQTLNALFGQKGLHNYPYMEVPLNTYLYHLDIAPADEDSRWQRFIFDNVKNILSFASGCLGQCRIYVQSKRENGTDYQLKRILAISKGRTHSIETVYVFTCTDSSIIYSEPSEQAQINISNLEKIWDQSIAGEHKKSGQRKHQLVNSR